jgi:hypothetical protein
MTTTDSIAFIKETKTCQYTLVINTPRLCGEPGFKSPREDVQDTPLRCRKIVETLDAATTDPTLPDAPSPLQRRKPKPLPAPPSLSSSSSSRSNSNDKNRKTEKGSNPGGGGGAAGSGSGGSGSGSSSRSGAGDKSGSAKDMDKQEMRSQLIKAALDALFGRNQEEGNDNTANNQNIANGQRAGEAGGTGGGGTAAKGNAGGAAGNNAQMEDVKVKLADNLKAGNLDKFIAVTLDEDGEIYVDSLEDRLSPLGELREGDNEDEGIMEIELAGGEDAVRLMKILREAGYDAHLPGEDDDQGSSKKKKKRRDDEELGSHDEL